GSDALDKGFDGNGAGREPFHQKFSPALPGDQENEEDDCDQKRKPAAVKEFDGVRAEKRQVDNREYQEQRQSNPQRPVPELAHQHEGQYRVDGHGAGYRGSIGAGKMTGRSETEHQTNN